MVMPKKALILCGGLGTRLRPITYEIPKSLIPIQEKPILEHLIELFKKYGINEIFLSVGYLKEMIKDHFKDGSSFGVKINYIEEDQPLGTGGPVKLAKALLTETFIVSNGDELKDINIKEMHEAHERNKALITIALTKVEDPTQYGVASMEGSRILEFIEKPENPKSDLISSGFYIMEPEVIDLLEDGFQMLEKNLFPKISEKGRLFGFPFEGQWFDCGSFSRYDKAIKEWQGIS
jgi:NDP-sugar pyrophosphorylase family protein